MQITSRPQTISHGRLLQILGVGFGLAVIIGNTIGAGILRTPGTIAEQLPNTWWYLGAWAVGGLYALLGAVSLAELGAMLPKSGGQYVFVRHALGEYAGFVAGWSDWISTCGSIAAVSLVIGGFAEALFTELSGQAALIAIAVALLFASLQWRGMVWGSSAQNLTSLLKAIAFLILIGAAFVVAAPRAAEETTQALPVGSSLLLAVVISLQGIIYTYDGWTGVIYFSEEVKNPGRDIPRAMIGGVLSVILIYLLVNLAIMNVLRFSDFAGKDFAAGALAQAIFGEHGDTIFRVLTIVSMLSAVNACQLMATRVLFAMSRDGLFAAKTAEVNKGGTPDKALIVSFAVALVFIFFGQTFEKVITILAFFFVGTYVLSLLSVFVLRVREPSRERPYRAWGYPWTTGLALAASVGFLLLAIWSDTKNSVYALILLAASYPVFRLTKVLTQFRL
ncbi:MAG TPA: APC family permease [Pyrinomonadaceae bacterium]|nr:APC family permease [Pyrinomonadaceae bacterium]